jgi:hypothetical protein
MLRLAAAAALAALPAAAQDGAAPDGAAHAGAAQDGVAREEASWGPVAEELGIGSGICLDTENIVCALVLCEDGALTVGVLGTATETGGELPAFRGQLEVDGKTVERDMQSRVVMGDSYYVRTPVEPGDPLWQRLRAGNSLVLSSAPEGEPLDYSLRGSAAELDRVAAGCR